LASTLGALNPFRYRGYVYDTETGLYYLQSRYYDPEVGRFINADIYMSTGQGVLGNNSYAYCANNPTSRVDDEGEFFNTICGAILGGAIAALTRKRDEITGEPLEDGWQAFKRGAIAGGIGGFFLDVSIATAGAGTAALIAVGGGAIAGVADHLMEQKHLGEEINAEGILVAATVGGAMNMLFMGTGREAGRFVGKTAKEVFQAVGKNFAKDTMNKSMTKFALAKATKSFVTNAAYASTQSFFGVLFNKAGSRISTLR